MKNEVPKLERFEVLAQYSVNDKSPMDSLEDGNFRKNFNEKPFSICQSKTPLMAYRTKTMQSLSVYEIISSETAAILEQDPVNKQQIHIIPLETILLAESSALNVMSSQKNSTIIYTWTRVSEILSGLTNNLRKEAFMYSSLLSTDIYEEMLRNLSAISQDNNPYIAELVSYNTELKNSFASFSYAEAQLVADESVKNIMKDHCFDQPVSVESPEFNRLPENIRRAVNEHNKTAQWIRNCLMNVVTPFGDYSFPQRIMHPYQALSTAAGTYCAGG